MGYPMTGTQYFPQQGYGYGYGMGYPSAGYPASGYPTYPPQQPDANAGGTDPNAILGAVIQPLMGLVMSLLTGTSTSDQSQPADPTQEPSTEDPGVSDAILGPDSEASDYLDVLSQNDSELKDLEDKFGNGDSVMTAEEVHSILSKIEKGNTKGIDVSADLQAALTWLDQDSTGQDVFGNLANLFDKEGPAGVHVKKGFDESAWKDVDGDIEDNLVPDNAKEALEALNAKGQELAKKVSGSDGDKNFISQKDIEAALQSNDFSLEEKAQLRFIRENFKDITDAMYQGDGLNIKLGDLATKVDDKTKDEYGNVIADELQKIKAKK